MEFLNSHTQSRGPGTLQVFLCQHNLLDPGGAGWQLDNPEQDLGLLTSLMDTVSHSPAIVQSFQPAGQRPFMAAQASG